MERKENIYPEMQVQVIPAVLHTKLNKLNRLNWMDDGHFIHQF